MVAEVLFHELSVLSLPRAGNGVRLMNALKLCLYEESLVDFGRDRCRAG